MFKVTFIDGETDTIAKRRVPEGEKAIKPTTDPTKEGHTFVEWQLEGETTAFDFDTPITGNITLKAVWTINTYTVTFDTDEGTPILPTEEVSYGDKVTEPTTDPTKEGHDFVEWRKEGETTAFNFGTPITGSITLKAIWSDKSLFKVTFIDGETDTIAKRRVPEGEKAIKPTTDPTKEGHTLVEWQLEGETTAFDFDTPITGNITLKAVWTINTYTVTFDTDEGTPIPPTEEVSYGKEDKANKPNDPTKEGHDFVEWRKEGETTAFNFGTPITGNITLKAVWTINTYIVTFDTDEGTPIPPTEEVSYGDKVTEPTTDPTKEGHDFVEWRKRRRNYSL